MPPPVKETRIIRSRRNDASKASWGIEELDARLAVRQPEYAQIIDKLPVAAYAIDAEGRLAYFNRAAADLAGREPRLGSDMWCVTWKLFEADGAPLPREKCPMAIALKERREIRGVEAIVERPDGSRLWIEPFPTLLFDAEGELTGAVNVLIDITERKRAADVLRDADRRKNRFLAQISHELRNPLSAIQNSIRVLLNCDNSTEAERRPPLLSIIHRQADHLAHLVDDLLEISRITHGKIVLKKDRVYLNDILQHAIETVRPSIDKKSHALKVQLPSESIRLNADPVRLSQVFANLLNNSAKFSEDSGVVSLVSTQDGNEAVVAVSDNGIGISEEMLPKVFELFTQVDVGSACSQSGLGIGLALVRNLVELHGGNVKALSDGLGKGSTFVVRLPIDS
jgi:PAS domain S-box-containing protein